MGFITELNKELQDQLSKVKHSVTIVTGYITASAFDFIDESICRENIEKIIIFKFNLYDFQNGSSSFEFQKAIQRGWHVYIDESVHAKNYIFDKKQVIIGSSNCTINGLSLNNNRKDDNNVLLPYTEEMQKWIQTKIKGAYRIKEDEAHKYDSCLKNLKKTNIEQKQLKLDMKLKSKVIEKIIVGVDEEGFNKYRKVMCKETYNKIKSDCMNFLEHKEINLEDYRCRENIEWYKKYIIILNNKYNEVQFSYSNPIYKYTYKIYSVNKKRYLERIYGEPINFSSTRQIEMLLDALRDTYKQGIIVKSKEAVLVNETIKFKIFYPKNNETKEQIEKEYKKVLLEKVGSNHALRQLVSKFSLKQEG